MSKKGQKEPCHECIIKDNYIALKEENLQTKIELIASLQAQILLQQNKIDQMKYETEERQKTQYTPRKDRKTA